MSAPRPVTPQSAPVAPRNRTPIAPVPWALEELKSPPASPIPLHLKLGRGPNGGCTASELTSLREEMQAQQMNTVREARRAGYDEGRLAGRTEAERAAETRVGTLVQAVSAAATSIRQHEEHYLGVLEENLTALACAVARQVMQREVQVDPSAIRELVQQALAEFPQEGQLRVRLNPLDHTLLSGDSGYPDVTWVADARVERGGCVVEGRERIVDGRVDMALEQIFRRVTGMDA